MMSGCPLPQNLATLCCVAFILATASLFSSGAGYAAESVLPAVAAEKPNNPIAFNADELQVKDNDRLVIATGHVEIIQNPRILTADRVEYNRETGLMIAEGNVSLMEENQNVVFADRFEITGDLKNGFADHIRLLLADNSRLAAVGGERRDGNKTILQKAVYSPCAPCQEHPEKAPLWQVKARTAVNDEVSKDVIYRDAVLEFAGVPVFYTPYFSHPAPDVYQRSGLLSSSVGSDRELGGVVRTYTYFAIDPYLDTTLEATATANQGEVLGSEWRKRWDFGSLDIGGSLSNSDRSRGIGANKETIDTPVRGHFFANGRFDLNDEWRSGFDILRSTDDTYLREFRYSEEDMLRNRLYAEYFNRRDFASVDAYYFQDLRPGISENSPYVIPVAKYQMLGDPGTTFGGRWKIDTGMQSLYRPQGADSYRTDLSGDWERRWQLPGGFLATTNLGARGDAYITRDQDQSPFSTGSAKNDDTQTRFLPSAQTTVSYPMVADLGWAQHSLEPLASVIVSPSLSNSKQIIIPNEDSRDLEFDSSNLFSDNRFPGDDRVESGTRVIYGLRSGWYGGWGFTRTFLGQSLRLDDDQILPENTGLEDNVSDIVGSLRSQIHDYIDVDYRFRVNQSDLNSRRQEVTSLIGKPSLRANISYLLADGALTTDVPQDREQLYSGLSSALTDTWSVGGYNRRDLGERDGSLATGLYVAYRDECFNLSLNTQRNFTNRSGLESGDTIFLRVGFKNLGELESPNFGPDLFGRNKN